MENQFELKLNQIYKQIGSHAKIVLATCYNNKVSARKMSFIIEDKYFYFQTDSTFRKYQDIKQNNYVALCIDNIQIEGLCEEIGHPLENIEFIKKFKKYFNSSFEAYSSLDSERLYIDKIEYVKKEYNIKDSYY